MPCYDRSKIIRRSGDGVNWSLGMCMSWRIVIDPSWRGCICLKPDWYMYEKRGYACHNYLLLCMGITVLHANGKEMNLDALCIIYYLLNK